MDTTRTLIVLCIPLTFILSFILMFFAMFASITAGPNNVSMNESMIFLQFFPYLINVLLAILIFKDAKKNHKSGSWFVVGLLLGWFGAIIYLIASSAKISQTPGSEGKSNFLGITIPAEFYEQNPRPEKILHEQTPEVKRTRIEETDQYGRKVLYYENGKPIYEKKK